MVLEYLKPDNRLLNRSFNDFISAINMVLVDVKIMLYVFLN